MSDFSLFSLFTAGLACLVPLTAAYTKPVGAEPKGNAFKEPGLNSVLPVGQAFSVTWNPTTQGKVDLVLLKGPSANAVPQYAIAEGIPNNGLYVWTPSDDLAPSDPSTPAMGYGIQLIDVKTGQYQFTTQFGISNTHYKKPSSSSSAAEYATTTTHKTRGHGAIYPTNGPVYTTYCSESTTLTMYNHTYITSGSVTITKPASYSSSRAPMGTGYTRPSNATTLAPTIYHPSSILSTVAASTAPAATYQGPAQQTGAASNVAGSIFGLVAAAGVAVLAI